MPEPEAVPEPAPKRPRMEPGAQSPGAPVEAVSGHLAVAWGATF